MVDREFDATAYNQGLEEGRREGSARIKLLEARLRHHVETCSACNGNGSYLYDDAILLKQLWRDCPDCEEDRVALNGK
jgi:DnaJ-class molecular chaperone